MRGFRDLMRDGRADLHDRMAQDALYVLPVAGGDPDVTPCTVRVHESFNALGDQKGTSFQYAERVDVVPQIVFLRYEIENPLRGAIVSLERGIAYRIDSTPPPDGLTVTVTATRITRAADLADLPIPGEWVAP
jgi:hypothetical protein